MGFLATMMRATSTGGLVTMNIGAFDEERLVFGQDRPTSAVSIGPIPKFRGFPLTISSYRGVLTLWLGFREEYVAAELAERCLEGIDAELALGN
jgi:NRPS condensation-like uncharacterized protein